ncbi:MAG: DUF3352 domain-containing protein [Phycisphaerae bacterium]|jgi:prepilin-type processing-associated H-X9-DG protein
MTACRCNVLLGPLAGCVLATAVALAGEPGGSRPPEKPLKNAVSQIDPTREAQVPSAILQLAPSDAWLVAYTAKGEQAFRHSVIQKLTGGQQGTSVLARTLSATLDGPVMLTVRGMPVNPLTWRVTLLAQTSLDRGDLFDRLRMNLIPAWNRSPLRRQMGELTFAHDEQYGYLTFAKPIPMSLTLMVRDSRVYGFSGPETIDEYLGEVDATGAFVDGDEFRRLSAGRRAPVGTLVYVNLRTLVPLAAPLLDQAVPKLYHALQLDTMQSAAVIASGPLTPGTLRLAVGISETEPGAMRLIASAPANTAVAKALPKDTTFALCGSYRTASEVMEDLMASAAVIDREIVDEYLAERSEFKRDVGLDPQTDLLADFAGGWALGGQTDLDRLDDAVLVLEVGRVDRFKAHLHTLRTAFGLETTTSHYRGVAIEKAQRSLGTFHYAVLDGLLILSREPQALHRSIDAIRDGAGLDRAPGFRAITDRVGTRTSKLVYLDLGSVLAQALDAGEDLILPGLEKLADEGTTVGLAVVPHDRMIALEFASSDGTSSLVSDVVFLSLSESLKQARLQAARAVSMSHVKGLLVSCKIYAHNNRNRWPAELGVVIADGSIIPQMLQNPYDDAASLKPGSYYLYRPIKDESTVKDFAEEVVISEPEVHEGGAVIGFADGHVEWVRSPRADELIANMRSGR